MCNSTSWVYYLWWHGRKHTVGDFGEGPKEQRLGLDWVLSESKKNNMVSYLNKFYLQKGPAREDKVVTEKEAAVTYIVWKRKIFAILWVAQLQFGFIHR